MYDKETERVRKRYDRISRFYDAFVWGIEGRLFRRLRKETLGRLEGRILEVGVGTGKNLQYYSSRAEVTGIDISARMLEKAKVRAKDSSAKVTLYEMDAQELTFGDSTFDYVVATFVLCSVPDPVRTAEEMRRVVKPRGKIILIEHVLSRYRLIALFEHVHNPLTSTLFGFNVNRDTKANIEKANLCIISDEELGLFDIFRRFTCSRGTCSGRFHYSFPDIALSILKGSTARGC